MDSQEQKEKYEELMAASRRMKKRLLWILLGILGIFALMLSVLLILNFAFARESEPPLEIDFFAPYEGDIFEFEEYLSLDRSIFYFDGAVYRSIEEDGEESFDRAVLFMRDFLKVMMRGDAEAYNAAFTENPRQEAFSQQMIYEAAICSESYSNDGGDKLIVYRLEYKIHRNDGTLRRDVGSDGMRPQWAIVRVTDDGRISIDSLTVAGR